MKKSTLYQKGRIVFSVVVFLMAFLFSQAQTQVSVVASGGTASANYSTLGGAFRAINAGTHSGVITVTINANTTETTTDTINSGTSGSANYTLVTIIPNGSRSITGSISGAPLIKFNGAANVKFDGHNSGGDTLKISNTSTGGSGTCTIQFINDANTDTIQNCILLGSPGFSTTAIVYFSTAINTGNTGILIDHNNIGPAGNTVANFQAVYSNGTFNKPNISNSITNNNIYDFSNMGVDLASGGGTGNSWNISNNSFYRTSAYTFNSFPGSAILVNSSSSNSCTINGNFIGGKSANGGTASTPWNNSTTSFVGINIQSVGTTSASTLLGNHIQNFTSATTTQSPAFAGIELQAGNVNVGDGTAGNQNVIGNAASNLGISIGSTFANSVYGIYCIASSSNTININNNVIENIAYTGTSNVNDIVYGIFYSSTAKAIVKNCKIHDLTSSCAYTSNSNPIMAGIYTNASAAASPIIQGNEIYNLTASSTAVIEPMYGIGLTGSSATPAAGDVSANFIHNLNGVNSTTTTAVTVGINIAGGSCNYYNNMIQLGVNSTGGSIAKGIPLIGINYVGGTSHPNHFFFNTVFVGGTAVLSSANTFCFYRGAAPLNTPSDTLRDNIFYNARIDSTGSAKNYAIANNGVLTRLTSDYNDLFAGTTNLASTVSGSGTATTFSGWQSATSFDAHSQNANPLFVSALAAPPDFHLIAGTPCDQTGTPVTTISIPTDFYGSLRASNTPTDIGAVVFKSEEDPDTLTAVGVSTSQINLTATANANNDSIVVVHNLTGTFTAPVNGVAHGNVGSAFAGGTIVYFGLASGLTNDTGLLSNTTYFYKAFSYNAAYSYSGGITANATTFGSPVITIDSSLLTSLFANYGTPSDTGSFVVSGSGLVSGILVSAPVGFEIAISPDSVFGPTLTLPLTGTVVNPTSVYIRLASTTPAGEYQGNITASSSSDTATVAMPVSDVFLVELDILPDNLSKCYGDTVIFSGTEFLLFGLVNNDTVTSLTLTSDGANTDADPGDYVIDGSDAVGTGLSNYFVNYLAGLLTVNSPLTPPTAPDPQLLCSSDSTDFVFPSVGGESGDMIEWATNADFIGETVQPSPSDIDIRIPGNTDQQIWIRNRDYTSGCVSDAVTTEASTDACSRAFKVSKSSTSNCLTVYPNPATDNVTVNFSSATSSVSLQLLSTTGELIATQSYNNLDAGNHLYSFDLRSLASGIYFITLVNDNTSINKKISVVH